MDCQLASSEVLKINLHRNETLLYPPALISNSHFIYLFIFYCNCLSLFVLLNFIFKSVLGLISTAVFVRLLGQTTMSEYNEFRDC